VSSAREQILKLLTTDWLIPEGDVPTSTTLLRNNVSLFAYLTGDALQPIVVHGN